MDDEQLDYEPLGIWDPSLRQDFSEYLRRYAHVNKVADQPKESKRFSRKKKA